METALNFKSVFVETYKIGRDNAVRHVAAGLAYYMLFSIAPLLLIVISVAGFFVESGRFISTLISFLNETFGSQIATLFESMIFSASVGGVGVLATIVSAGFVIWGAGKFILRLERALNMIYFGEEKIKKGLKGVIHTRVNVFINLGIMVVFIILSFVASVTVPFLLNFFDALLPLPEMLLFFLQSVGVLLIIALVFSAVFRLLGQKTVSWKAAFLGALATAFVFIVLNTLFGVYFSSFSGSNLYGAAGSVLALLLWLYWSSQILLYGAIFSYVLEQRF